MRKIRIIFLCFFLYSSLGCAYLGYLKDPFSDIPNFRQVSPLLYRGGKPSLRGWEKLKSLGVKTVINLEETNKRNNRESAGETTGIKVFRLPISLYNAPGDEQVFSFLEIVSAKENQPVFIHCNNGRDRTGVMIALYRIVMDGWTIKNAYREAVALGYWPYYGEDAPLKKFIHQLKEKKPYFQKAEELKNGKIS